MNNYTVQKLIYKIITKLPISATNPEEEGGNRVLGNVHTDKKASHLRTTNRISWTKTVLWDPAETELSDNDCCLSHKRVGRFDLFHDWLLSSSTSHLSGWAPSVGGTPPVLALTVQSISPFKWRCNLNHIWRIDTYRAVNTLRFGYKSQSFKARYGNNRALFWDPYKTQTHLVYRMCDCRRIRRFSNGD